VQNHSNLIITDYNYEVQFQTFKEKVEDEGTSMTVHLSKTHNTVGDL